MITPEQLRKISEKSSAEKMALESVEKAKVYQEKLKLETKKLAKEKEKATRAIVSAEMNMESVARQGLCAALVYCIEDDEIIEGNLRSLGSGSQVDSPDNYLYTGAAKTIFKYFVDKGYSVMIHTIENCYEDSKSKKYYIKVGW
jgi:hypothetical protein